MAVLSACFGAWRWPAPPGTGGLWVTEIEIALMNLPNLPCLPRLTNLPEARSDLSLRP
jgi:hypothetical protein